MLSFLYSPTLTSIHDHWKNHSLDETTGDTRVTVDILGISELKWTRMGGFNSDDLFIYYCGYESFRRNGVALMVNKRV